MERIGMKKWLSALCAVVLVATCLFTFTACGNKNLVESSNSTASVISNGGMLTVHNGYLYFVNGTNTNNGKNNTYGSVTQGAICRIPVDENGNIQEKEDGSLPTAEVVVPSLVGFDLGSVAIYGDYLYYSTPSNQKNVNSEVLYGLTEFRRLNLNNIKGKTELMYTTKSSDDTVDFTYYTVGDKTLYLVVYEKSSNNITSIRLGKNPVTKVIASNVKNYLFAEQSSANAMQEGVSTKVYYTTEADNASYETGVKVYSMLPDGSQKTEIGSGEDYSLLAIRAGKLYYSYTSGDYTYMYATTDGATFHIQTDTLISASRSTYDKMLFLEDGSIVIQEKTKKDDKDVYYVRRILWQNKEIAVNYILYKGQVEFLGIYGNSIIFTDTDDGTINKVDYTKDNSNNENTIILCEEEFEKADGNLVGEIIGDYVYGFINKAVDEDSTTKKTYVYRVPLNPAEDEVVEAELVAVL